MVSRKKRCVEGCAGFIIVLAIALHKPPASAGHARWLLTDSLPVTTCQNAPSVVEDELHEWRTNTVSYHVAGFSKTSWFQQGCVPHQVPHRIHTCEYHAMCHNCFCIFSAQASRSRMKSSNAPVSKPCTDMNCQKVPDGSCSRSDAHNADREHS